jgi:urease accessory protein
MRQLTRRLEEEEAAEAAARVGRIDGELTLASGERRRSRFRARLDGGEEVAVLLPRGTALRGGDLLAGDEPGGSAVRVRAARETVSTVHADGAVLARAAYHLGNRHVAVEIGDGWLRYRHDHVLDDMVARMGLAVDIEEAPLEPESGAYGHAHPHAHDRGGEP